MKLSWSNLTVPAKAVVICITILLVASGLCGLQWTFVGKHWDNNHNVMIALFMLTGVIELLVMALSAVGAVVAAFIWIARAK